MKKITLYSLSVITSLYLLSSFFALQLIWSLDAEATGELAGMIDFSGQVLFVFLVSISAYLAWRYYFETKYKYALILIYAPLGLYVFVSIFSAFFLS